MSNDFISTRAQKESFTQCVLVCCVCGQKHNTNDCSVLQDIHYIWDSPVISHARQTLPQNLEIVSMADGTTTVITKVDLPKGTTFGPLCARKMYTMNPSSEFPIKLFGNTATETYYLDFSNENQCNWMSFISPASNDKEQNLICYQVKQDIFYTTMRTIVAGEEIRVWYAPYYAFKMKMPLYNKNFAIYNNVIFPETEQFEECKVPVTQYKKDQALLSKGMAEELAQKLPAQRLGAASDTGIWNCKFCLTTTKSVISYAKHLMEHYKPLLGIFCNICNKKCHNISVLQRHKNIKHGQVNESVNNDIFTKENQNSEVICPSKVDGSDYETLAAKRRQIEKLKADKNVAENIFHLCATSNNKEHKLSLPLLDNNLLNVGDLLQSERSLNINLGLTTISDSIVPDNVVTSVKFNMEELVPELLDTMHEKLTNLDCDICDKKFDKVDYLYRHLRKHTGEFICPSCLVVFARKENLLSHACLSKNLEYNYECSFCQKLFAQKKYLQRHMAKHNEVINCKWCHHVFSSPLDHATHKCPAPHYVCEQCKKRFVNKAHLNRHIKLHCSPKPVRKKVKKRKEESTTAICEKCGDTFRNSYTLKQHLYTHGERMFECDICHSRFHRMAVLKEHKTIHQSAQIPCNICGKRLKSKKALNIHMLLHGNKKHQCDKCDKSFFQKCNYLKHYKHMHEDKVTYNCPHCSMLFTNKQSFDKHLIHHVKPAQYSCTLCKKMFHKECQMKRHVQTSHSGIIYRCPFCNMTARHRHSMRRHFERQHKTLRNNWDKMGFVNQLAEKSPQLIVTEMNLQQRNILENNYIEEGSNEFKNIHIKQGKVHEFGVDIRKDKGTPNWQEKDSSKQTLDTDSMQNEHAITRIQSEENDQSRETKGCDLSVNEIPQVNISETSDNVSDTVLRSAYIYDDDGEDIMFYVLQ